MKTYQLIPFPTSELPSSLNGYIHAVGEAVHSTGEICLPNDAIPLSVHGRVVILPLCCCDSFFFNFFLFLIYSSRKRGYQGGSELHGNPLVVEAASEAVLERAQGQIKRPLIEQAIVNRQIERRISSKRRQPFQAWTGS